MLVSSSEEIRTTFQFALHYLCTRVVISSAFRFTIAMLQEKALLLQPNFSPDKFPHSEQWNFFARPQFKSRVSEQYIAVEPPPSGRTTTISETHRQERAKINSSKQWVVARRHGRKCLTTCRSHSEKSVNSTDAGDIAAAQESESSSKRHKSGNFSEFGFSDGPVESSGPKFSRQPFSSLSFIPVNDPAAVLPPATKIKLKQGIRRGRRAWKKISAPQAMTGAVFGAVWVVIALKGTAVAYEHLDSHPLARDLPMGLTKQVNQLMLTMVTGLGGFAVVMFFVTSFGLLLLSLKLLATPKPPAS